MYSRRIVRCREGETRRRIALTYGARIAILPNFTGFAMALGALLGGTVLVETIFNYPGMGRLFLEAVSNKDFPLMQALFLVITVGLTSPLASGPVMIVLSGPWHSPVLLVAVMRKWYMRDAFIPSSSVR